MIVVLVFILVYSIILHEVSHGCVAYLNGDTTAEGAGRLTLNPVSHIDLFGTVFLPAVLMLVQAPFLIGWAKPVPINPLNFRRRSIGLLAVSLAGPLTNLLLAWGFSLARGAVPSPQAADVLSYGIVLNVVLAVFNLIPIPPLDGSKVLAVFLPGELRRLYFLMEPWGLFIIVLLLATGLLHVILVPLYRTVLGWFMG